MRHHAGGYGARLRGVAAHRATGLGSDAQVARVHKLDVFRGFRKPFRKRAFGKIRTVSETRIARLDVGFFFCGIIFGGISRGDGCDGDGGVAAVAIRAPQMNRFRRMHGGFIGRGVAGDTAGRFVIRFFLRLASKRRLTLAGRARLASSSHAEQVKKITRRRRKRRGFAA